MTKAELIQELSCFDNDDEVRIGCPSGDYWGTFLAREVTAVEQAEVAESSYHNTFKVVDDENRDNYEPNELKKVILLS